MESGAGGGGGGGGGSVYRNCHFRSIALHLIQQTRLLSIDSS